MRSPLLALALLAGLAACQQATGRGTPAPKPLVAPQGDTTRVIAGIDTIGITEGMIDQLTQPHWGQVVQRAQQTGQRPEILLAELRRQATAMVLQQTAVLLEAKRRSDEFPVDDTLVLAQFRALQSRYPDTAQFLAEMLQAGETPASIKAQMADQMRAQQMIEKVLIDSIPLSDSTVKAWYHANQAQLGSGTRYLARHILKLSRDPADPAPREAITRLAAKLAKADTATFGRVARAESDDPGSKAQGGSLGWFNPADMVPEFAQAVAGLRKGQVSAPVQTPFGWHLILLEDMKTMNIPPLDEIRGQVESRIRAERQPQVLRSFAFGLMRQYRVAFIDTTYRDTSLASFPSRRR